MRTRPLLSSLTGLSLLLTLATCKLATVRPLDPETGRAVIGNEAEEFDAERYVADIWDDPLLVTVRAEATELAELLSPLREDEEAAAERYGHEVGSAYSFIVTGQGQVLSVATESRAGLMNVDLAPLDGEADVALAIGPVVSGNALRDALPFISFNDFTNQIEFANVSKALNTRALESALGTLEPQTMVGKQIRFYGAFTLTDLDEIIVIPVEIEVEG